MFAGKEEEQEGSKRGGETTLRLTRFQLLYRSCYLGVSTISPESLLTIESHTDSETITKPTKTSGLPSLVFVPGSWHKPACFNKIIEILQTKYNIKCVAVTLPSTSGDPNATFKDDLDAARTAIATETAEGRDVIVIAHSYGGIVGSSAIKGFTHSGTSSENLQSGNGFVKAYVLIASGFAIRGLSFMDPLFGVPPPAWRVNKETGFADIASSPSELFYHDLPAEEAAHHVAELTPQSLKALFEGGEYVWDGWKEVPNWYLGTIEDRGLPVVLQRMQVGMARGQGAIVHHSELMSSHSPFLSQPDEVVATILEAVQTVTGMQVQDKHSPANKERTNIVSPQIRLNAPTSWIKYGLPLMLGRGLGYAIAGFMALRSLWRQS